MSEALSKKPTRILVDSYGWCNKLSRPEHLRTANMGEYIRVDLYDAVRQEVDGYIAQISAIEARHEAMVGELEEFLDELRHNDMYGYAKEFEYILNRHKGGG